MTLLTSRKVRKVLRDPNVHRILGYFEHIKHRPLSEVFGANWRESPISLSSEALILVVNAEINWYGESVTSETFDLEFRGSGSSGKFHLWNDKGVITNSPINLNIRDHMDDQLAEAILDTKPDGHCGCWVVVEKDGVVVSGKFFSLSKEITQWIVKAGTSFLNEKCFSNESNEVMTVQRVEKLGV